MDNQMHREGGEIKEDLILKFQDQQGLLGSQVVRQGTVGVLLRNGRVDQIIKPGKQLMLRLPFQKVETLLVDTKIRNLRIVSQGEFLTMDQWRVNISLWVSYRVVNPARIAVEYAPPVHALYSTVKNLLGQAVNMRDFQTLSQMGRQVVRQEILNGSPQVEQTLGIALVDVRVDDLTLPERVGTAFDERQVAQMEGEAAQWRLRGKWQDMPDAVRQSHLQERLVEGAMFVNPPLPGMVMGPGVAGVPPQVAGPTQQGAALQGLPPGQVIEGQVARTHQLDGEVWGQLTIVGGPRQGVVFPLRKPLVAVGRAGGNDVVLQDDTASGRHARFELRGAQAFVVDQGSSNGIFVNGQRVQQIALNGGEVILMGGTYLRFERL